MTPEIRMIPDGHFSNKDLERLLVELEARFKAKEVMHPKEAAAFLGIGMTSLYKSDLPHHNIKGIQGRIYLRSELIDFIKQG